MDGFLPKKSSLGVLSGCRLVDQRLRISPAAFTASAHRCPGSPFSSRRHLVMSSRDWFLLSAVPFLLRCIGRCEFVSDPFERAESGEVFWNVFAPVVCSQSTYFLPCRVFNYPKEMLKFFKHLTFLCNEVYSDFFGEVVSKGDKKSRSTCGADAKRAANVRVY